MKNNSNTLRRTKIVATLGPATDDEAILTRMIENGLNVVRLNFSHGSHEDQVARVETVRNISEKCGKAVGILVDLQGPKIRIAKFKNKKIDLTIGQALTIDCAFDENAGTDSIVGVTYKTLYKEVKVGNELLLDDGAVVLEVKSLDGKKIHCEVLVGEELSNSKGLNLRGGGLSAGALTDKDKEDIKIAGQVKADYVAVSFVCNAEEVNTARKLFFQAGGNGGIVSKIERAEAIDNLEEIIEASDVAMVARGDLGVEIGDAELPAIQKRIISMARNKDCATITATQMMQSMVESPLPTRAEVLDVANSIIDGTDAVMLSAESAVGKHPDLVIETMDRICCGAERNRIPHGARYRDDGSFADEEESIAMAAMYVANKLNVVAIVALTESGHTAKLMSRVSSGIPIFALSRHSKTVHRVSLYRGVYPLKWDLKTDKQDYNYMSSQVFQALEGRLELNRGDQIVITQGDMRGVQGQTNTLRIITVE